MTPFQKLANYFAKFPGIGERQARRFAYFLLQADQGYVKELVELMQSARKSIKHCTRCFRLFDSSAKNICDICENPKRDQSIILVIEKDADFESVEKSKTYNGLYFILGGLVPLVEKTTPQQIRINELKKRLGDGTQIKETILAFSLTPSGEHTDSYMRELLRSLGETHGFKISSFGKGLSTGTELEYSDRDTLKNALENRQ